MARVASSRISSSGNSEMRQFSMLLSPKSLEARKPRSQTAKKPKSQEKPRKSQEASKPHQSKSHTKQKKKLDPLNPKP